jgi:polyphosphate kinase
MVRSFDRRIESLFLLEEDILRKQAINNLRYNLKDNVNSYVLREDGTYVVKENAPGEPPFNIHKEFYNITKEIVTEADLF